VGSAVGISYRGVSEQRYRIAGRVYNYLVGHITSTFLRKFNVAESMDLFDGVTAILDLQKSSSFEEITSNRSLDS
jgi:hypothetical protein